MKFAESFGGDGKWAKKDLLTPKMLNNIIFLPDLSVLKVNILGSNN